MSNHLITEVYRRQLGSMARNAVMVLLADKASDDGTGIWASKQRMADELGGSKQTVIATIKTLIADGILREVGQRKCPNGFTIEYAIHVQALLSLPLVPAHQSNCFTGQTALPVKSTDLTSQAALPDQSSCLTQTLLNPPEPPIDTCASGDALSPDEVVSEWNELAQSAGLPIVRRLTPRRRKQLQARLRAFPAIEDWQLAFKTIRETPWMHGANDRGWRADFDFLLQEKSFTKLTEGAYGQA